MSETIMNSIQQLGESMPGGFFVYRADGDEEILYANEEILDIFGCHTMEEWKELTGFAFQGMVYPEDLERVQNSIRTQVSESEKQLGYAEHRIVRKDGTIRWVDDYGRCVHTEEYGDVYYVLMRDITQRRQEVADRLKMEMELQKEKHANEIKSSFLFNISHDIRTPMNAIKGFTDLALRHLEEPERLKDYLAKVDESTGHLIGLIDDLLEMSRLDYGKIEVREERCDIRESMDLVLDMFRAQAEEKQVILEEEVELPTQDVYIDDMRFRRIMGNLIGNAVKFTLSGGKVKVSAKQKQASGTGYVRYEFTVSDTGIGMSEEFMQRMYEAFEREESSTQSGYIGTGMGLAITKRLLDVMGGSISVKSKKGEGSTFTVGLPLKLADFAADKLPSASSEQAVHKASGEHRILLVEDVEINRLLAESVLQDAEFLVESVADGSDAVEAIKGHPLWYYDLVLMDIQMPVMNGYEATRAIRAMGREDTDSIPIIALSANARDEDKRMSMESGMNSHVAKPFDIAHLINTVNEHIEASKHSS